MELKDINRKRGRYIKITCVYDSIGYLGLGILGMLGYGKNPSRKVFEVLFIWGLFAQFGGGLGTVWMKLHYSICMAKRIETFLRDIFGWGPWG